MLEGLSGLGIDDDAFLIWDECTQIITVEDTTAPSIECPADLLAAENNAVECSSDPEDLDPESLGRPTVTDACSPAELTVGFRDNIVNVISNGSYTIRRRFQVRDSSGNVSFFPLFYSFCTYLLTVFATCPV